MAAGSLPRYHSALRIFGQYLSSRGVDALAVSREDLKGFIEYMRKDREASQKTIDGHERQLIGVEDMARLINSTLDIRDKAIITLLAKTGIRRGELVSLDVNESRENSRSSQQLRGPTGHFSLTIRQLSSFGGGFESGKA
jgi:site-specific recombinase XerD